MPPAGNGVPAGPVTRGRALRITTMPTEAQQTPRAAIVVFVVGWIVAMVTNFVSLANSMKTASMIPFWSLFALVPTMIPVYFCFFFGAAVLLSQLAHACLAFEKRPRLLAFLGVLFSFDVEFILWFAGQGLLRRSLAEEIISELTLYIMFYSLCWAASRRGPRWLIFNVVLWSVWSIILSQYNPFYNNPAANAGGYSGEQWAYFTDYVPVWQKGLWITYWTLSALIRIGALVDCQLELANSALERWIFRLLILVHVGMFFATLGIQNLYDVSSVNNVELLLQSINIVVYCITPLILVHFLVLSHSRTRALVASVELATRQLAVARAAEESRRRFLR